MSKQFYISFGTVGESDNKSYLIDITNTNKNIMHITTKYVNDNIGNNTYKTYEGNTQKKTFIETFIVNGITNDHTEYMSNDDDGSITTINSGNSQSRENESDTSNYSINTPSTSTSLFPSPFASPVPPFSQESKTGKRNEVIKPIAINNKNNSNNIVTQESIASPVSSAEPNQVSTQEHPTQNDGDQKPSEDGNVTEPEQQNAQKGGKRRKRTRKIKRH